MISNSNIQKIAFPECIRIVSTSLGTKLYSNRLKRREKFEKLFVQELLQITALSEGDMIMTRKGSEALQR